MFLKTNDRINDKVKKNTFEIGGLEVLTMAISQTNFSPLNT